MHHLGIASAHVAGHFFGGVFALQLALDAHDLVDSLALLEPALMMVPAAQPFMEQAASGVRQLAARRDHRGGGDGPTGGWSARMPERS